MRDFKLRRRFNKFVKDGGAGGGGAGGKTIVLADIPVKTVTDGEHVYSSDTDGFVATIGGERQTYDAPVYFYDVSIGDVMELSEGGWTNQQMIYNINKAVVDGNQKSIAKTGETKFTPGEWRITKGTICETNDTVFVSADAVIEYKE